MLIGNGLYDEAIKHFSVLLQVGGISAVGLLYDVYHCMSSIYMKEITMFYLFIKIKIAAPYQILFGFFCRVTLNWSVLSMAEELLMAKRACR